MPTVAHVTSWGIPCGIARHLSYWLPCIGSEWRVKILASVPPYWYSKPHHSWGADVTRCWERGQSGALNGIKAEVQRCSASVVHFQFDPTWFDWKELSAFCSWARSHGVHTVATTHIVKDDDAWVYQNKQLCRDFDCIVGGTPGMAQAWRDIAAKFSIPLRGPVEYVPLAVPPVPAGLRSSDNHDVLTWGMLGHGKGHTAVWEAVKSLSGKYPDIRYRIIGAALTGEHRENLAELREIAKDSEGRMVIEERWPNEDEIYAECKRSAVIALAHVYPYQSSSGTVAISVASGTPVVAVESPMFDGYDGAVEWARESNGGIAAAIDRVFQGKGATARAKAADKAAAFANGSNVAHLYTAIYEKLLKIAPDAVEEVAEVEQEKEQEVIEVENERAPTGEANRIAVIMLLKMGMDKIAQKDDAVGAALIQTAMEILKR